jgi:rRNA-processing protein FCF1
MREVLFDANFLTIPVQFQIDILSETKKLVPDAKFITLTQVVEELKKINTKAAKFGLQLLSLVEVKEEPGKADDALLSYARKHDAIVCTNDQELKKRCLNEKVPVIFMRKKKTLEIQGEDR